MPWPVACKPSPGLIKKVTGWTGRRRRRHGRRRHGPAARDRAPHRGGARAIADA